jgi:cytochrome c5
MHRHVLTAVVPLVAAACLLVAVGSSAQDPDPAEKIINVSCVECHDIRNIQTAAMSADGWTATVNSMIEMGAKVAPADVPVLVTYLARNHGPVPEGPGRAILLNTCTMCHDLKRIRLGHRSPEEWEETLGAMLNEGAPLSDQQFPVIHEYLSRHFGVE